MTAPINLNRFRKDRARAEAREMANNNAAKHGLSKAEKVMTAARTARAARLLDQHRADDEE
ncbi:MAG: DUF4169 family protein [Paracoccaceae bacterium]